MGICESKKSEAYNKHKPIPLTITHKYESKKFEAFTGHKPISLEIVNKVLQSLCKITVKTNKGIIYGTGFFMNYSDSLKCLITNYHVINPSAENRNIEIEIHNKKKWN